MLVDQGFTSSDSFTVEEQQQATAIPQLEDPTRVPAKARAVRSAEPAWSL